MRIERSTGSHNHHHHQQQQQQHHYHLHRQQQPQDPHQSRPRGNLPLPVRQEPLIYPSRPLQYHNNNNNSLQQPEESELRTSPTHSAGCVNLLLPHPNDLLYGRAASPSATRAVIDPQARAQSESAQPDVPQSGVVRRSPIRFLGVSGPTSASPGGVAKAWAEATTDLARFPTAQLEIARRIDSRSTSPLATPTRSGPTGFWASSTSSTTTTAASPSPPPPGCLRSGITKGALKARPSAAPVAPCRASGLTVDGSSPPVQKKAQEVPESILANRLVTTAADTSNGTSRLQRHLIPQHYQRTQLPKGLELLEVETPQIRANGSPTRNSPASTVGVSIRTRAATAGSASASRAELRRVSRHSLKDSVAAGVGKLAPRGSVTPVTFESELHHHPRSVSNFHPVVPGNSNTGDSTPSSGRGSYNSNGSAALSRPAPRRSLAYVGSEIGRQVPRSLSRFALDSTTGTTGTSQTPLRGGPRGGDSAIIPTKPLVKQLVNNSSVDAGTDSNRASGSLSPRRERSEEPTDKPGRRTTRLVSRRVLHSPSSDLQANNCFGTEKRLPKVDRISQERFHNSLRELEPGAVRVRSCSPASQLPQDPSALPQVAQVQPYRNEEPESQLLRLAPKRTGTSGKLAAPGASGSDKPCVATPIRQRNRSSGTGLTSTGSGPLPANHNDPNTTTQFPSSSPLNNPWAEALLETNIGTRVPALQKESGQYRSLNPTESQQQAFDQAVSRLPGRRNHKGAVNNRALQSSLSPYREEHSGVGSDSTGSSRQSIRSTADNCDPDSLAVDTGGIAARRRPRATRSGPEPAHSRKPGAVPASAATKVTHNSKQAPPVAHIGHRGNLRTTLAREFPKRSNCSATPAEAGDPGDLLTRQAPLVAAASGAKEVDWCALPPANSVESEVHFRQLPASSSLEKRAIAGGESCSSGVTTTCPCRGSQDDRTIPAATVARCSDRTFRPGLFESGEAALSPTATDTPSDSDGNLRRRRHKLTVPPLTRRGDKNEALNTSSDTGSVVADKNGSKTSAESEAMGGCVAKTGAHPTAASTGLLETTAIETNTGAVLNAPATVVARGPGTSSPGGSGKDAPSTAAATAGVNNGAALDRAHSPPEDRSLVPNGLAALVDDANANGRLRERERRRLSLSQSQPVRPAAESSSEASAVRGHLLITQPSSGTSVPGSRGATVHDLLQSGAGSRLGSAVKGANGVALIFDAPLPLQGDEEDLRNLSSDNEDDSSSSSSHSSARARVEADGASCDARRSGTSDYSSDCGRSDCSEPAAQLDRKSSVLAPSSFAHRGDRSAGPNASEAAASIAPLPTPSLAAGSRKSKGVPKESKKKQAGTPEHLEPPVNRRECHRLSVSGMPSSMRQDNFENKRQEIRSDTGYLSPGTLLGLGIGYACKKGLKPESPNQDDFFIVRVDDWGLYGVFDGHGPFGHDVSNFIQKEFPKLIYNDTNFVTNPKEALRKSFIHVHQLLEAAQNTHKLLDCSLSGSTATVVLHQKTQNKLFIAHVGDSRCVLGRLSKNGKKVQAVDLTSDHKPNCEAERKRITASGGQVRRLEGDIPYRVFLKGRLYPGLAMSRAIGDTVGQQAGVTCEPEVAEHVIDKNRDLFICLCSDGVWEFVTSAEAVDIVSANGLQGVQLAADLLAKESWNRWIKEEGNVVDDITAEVIYLDPEQAASLEKRVR